MRLPWQRKPSEEPLVPGRDRSAQRVADRPIYSYYSGSRETTRTTRVPHPATNVDNPSTRRIEASRAQRVIMTACVVVGALCVAKLLFLVPQSRIIFTGEQSTSQEVANVYARSADVLLRSSVLNMLKITLNSNGIAREMEQRFPELSSVVVAVPIVGNRPAVYVSLAPAALALDTKQGAYTIDGNGYILAPVKGSPALTRLRETSERQVKPGSQYLAGSIVTFALQAKYQLQQAGYEIAYFELPAAQPYELDAYLVQKPYHLRFNLQFDALQQSGGAVTLLKEATVQPNQYVDLRVPGRVYYK